MSDKIDFDELMMMAGMAGISEHEFWRSTLKYLYHRFEGLRKLEKMRVQSKYEVARYMAALLLQPYAKGGKAIKEKDLGRFYWELTEKEKKELEKKGTVDETKFKELQEKLDKGLKAGTIKWEPVKNIKDIK